MFCLYCGTRIPDDAVFCNSCGRRQNVAANPQPLTTTTLSSPYEERVPPPVYSVYGQPPQARSTELPTPFPTEVRPTPFTSVPAVAQNSPRVSRRTMIVGLTGLAAAVAVGGGITWFARSQKPPLGTTFLTYHGHTALIVGIGWSPDGSRIASASLDKTVQVWNPSTGEKLLTRSGTAFSSVAWSPDGRRIVFIDASSKVSICDVASGNTVLTYDVPSSGAIAWSPDGTRIASTGSDSVQVWDAVTGKPLSTYQGQSSSLAMAWSPDSKRLAFTNSDGNVQVWDASTGNVVLTYHGHTSRVNVVAWSPDGTRIASGGGIGSGANAPGDTTVQVWDASNGNRLLTYREHKNPIYAVAWSPDGGHVASGSLSVLYQNGTTTEEVGITQIWDTSTGNTTFTHNSGGFPAVWSPDGQSLATGEKNNTVQIWQAV